MRRLTTLLLLAYSFAASAAEGGLDDLRAKIRSGVESTCTSELSVKLKDTSKQQLIKSLPGWIATIADPLSYCACTAERFASRLTADQLSNQAGWGPLAKRSGTECILPKLKETFPSMCRDMVLDIAQLLPTEVKSEQTATQFCGCTKGIVDDLTPERFEPFAAATFRDYFAYQRTRALPQPDDTSLISRMSACGLSNLREQLLRSE